MRPVILRSGNRQNGPKLCHGVSLGERADDYCEAAPDERPRSTIPEGCIEITVKSGLLND